MFSWKPIYTELGHKLLAYRDKQEELLTWIQGMKQAALPVISLTDEEPRGTATDLRQIDPFTFFANFNRGIKHEHRVEILRRLKAQMGLTADLPEDFDGIPVANSQKAWFFPFAFERDPATVPLLWAFAQDVVANEPSSLNPDLFENCLKIKQVGLAKLTMGMFWLQPDRYVALDQVNRAYLLDQPFGLTSQRLKPKTLSEYLSLVALVQSGTQKDPARLSYDAFVRGQNVGLDPSVLDTRFRKYLQRLALDAQCSVAEVVAHITRPLSGGESEITNRTIHQNELQDALNRPELTKEELKTAVGKLWSLLGRQDIIRRTNYFRSDEVLNDVRALLDDDSSIEIATRIDNFIEAAVAHGYSGADHKDRTVSAQFASVLLSSRWPDRFVDFRQKRWNDLYKQVMQSASGFLRGKHYGHLLLRAGSFASLLAHTPTFREFFGESKELWTVAGVAWALKDKKPVEPKRPVSPKAQQQPLSLPGKNTILHGPPGTGKTYRLMIDYAPQFTGRSQFVTFHQSFSYEDFVEGIKPVLGSAASSDLKYEVKLGVLREIAARATADPGHNYAIFIDEINRGNIASIFGELITLIEDDKRIGAELEITVELPYSRERFGLPSNLYIVGTMNTADRSVESLDSALRRRFCFVACPPNLKVLPEGPLANLDVDLRQMLMIINGRLERLLDQDHCIGHSYFMDVATAAEPLDALRRAFAHKVLPLLEEYFYGDPGRIALVLGPAFVKKRQTPTHFANCGWEQDDAEDRETFDRTDPMTLDVGAFKAIYE